MNGVTVKALLDTGAQVSIVDRAWKEEHLSHAKVRPLRELLGCADDLEVYAVNGDLIPFDGWTVITVSLLGNEDSSLSINVPFLVSKMPIARPLLGFNIVEELIQGQPEQLLPTLTSLLAGAINVPNEKVEALVEVVRNVEEEYGNGRLKVGQRDTAYLRCLDTGEGLLELRPQRDSWVSIPIENNTGTNVTLPRGTVIGTLQSIERIVDSGQANELRPTTRIQAATTRRDQENTVMASTRRSRAPE